MCTHRTRGKKWRGCGDEGLKYNQSKPRRTVFDHAFMEGLIHHRWTGSVGSRKGTSLMGSSVLAANKFRVKVQEKKLLSFSNWGGNERKWENICTNSTFLVFGGGLPGGMLLWMVIKGKGSGGELAPGIRVALGIDSTCVGWADTVFTTSTVGKPGTETTRATWLIGEYLGLTLSSLCPQNKWWALVTPRTSWSKCVSD